MLLSILFAAGCSSPRETSGAADRASWLTSMLRIADPVLRHAAAGRPLRGHALRIAGLARKAPGFRLPGGARAHALRLAPCLELVGETDPRQAEYRLLARRALSRAVDPSDAGYMTFDHGRQPLVDAAYLAEGVLRARRQLWNELDTVARANLADALKRTRTIRPGESNWLLFASMVEAALLELTGSWRHARDALRYGPLSERLLQGRRDVRRRKVLPHGLLQQLCHPSDAAGRADGHGASPGCPTAVRWRPNAAAIPAMRPFWSAWWLPTGAIPMLGRSITACRFGVFHALGQSALLHALPKEVAPAQVRCAMTAVLRRQLERPDNFDREGWLRVGFVGGRQGGMAERYVNTGSLYHCLTFFLPLGLPVSDPFWSGAPVPWTNLKAWNGEPLPGDHALKEA